MYIVHNRTTRPLRTDCLMPLVWVLPVKDGRLIPSRKPLIKKGERVNALFTLSLTRHQEISATEVDDIYGDGIHRAPAVMTRRKAAGPYRPRTSGGVGRSLRKRFSKGQVRNTRKKKQRPGDMCPSSPPPSLLPPFRLSELGFSFS